MTLFFIKLYVSLSYYSKGLKVAVNKREREREREKEDADKGWWGTAILITS